MVVQGLLGKAAGTVVTGLVGVSAYEVLRKALGKAPLHDAAVTATARRESVRTQGTLTRIRPAASDTTNKSVMSKDQ